MLIYEKDIEKAYIEHLEAYPYASQIKSQVRLQAGILDIFYVSELAIGWGAPVVAEVKRGAVDEKACVQLLTYMAQIKRMLDHTPDEWSEYNGWRTLDINVKGELVGSKLTKKAERFLQFHHGIDFIQYKHLGGGWFSFEQDWGLNSYISDYHGELNEAFRECRKAYFKKNEEWEAANG